MDNISLTFVDKVSILLAFAIAAVIIWQFRFTRHD